MYYTPVVETILWGTDVKHRLYRRATSQAPQRIEKLLGELEAQIMNIAWEGGGTVVRDVVTRLNEGRPRPLAYTTVMTIMTRLVDKGLLERRLVGKAHYYTPAQTREQFLRKSSGEVIRALVADFGDVAIAQFIEEIERLDPDRIERLRRLARSETFSPSDSFVRPSSCKRGRPVAGSRQSRETPRSGGARED